MLFEGNFNGTDSSHSVREYVLVDIYPSSHGVESSTAGWELIFIYNGDGNLEQVSKVEVTGSFKFMFRHSLPPDKILRE
jgi:hypothetical protein